MAQDVAEADSTDDGTDAFWLQLELYIKQNSAKSPRDAAEALRKVAARIEVGETVGEVKDLFGEEIGWFQAENDPSDASET